MSYPITRQDFLKALPAFVPMIRSWERPLADDRRIELRSAVLRVTVVAGPGGVWLDRFFLKRAPFDAVSFTTDPWTNNLLQEEGAETPPGLLQTKGGIQSGSALYPDGEAWHAAYLGPTGHVTSDAASVHITGILVGPATAPLAQETWTITLHEDMLRWRVEREFLRAVTLRADRFPCLAMHTWSAEVVSFLDPAAQLQSPGFFPLEPAPSTLGEMISPNRTQQLHLSPSGLVLDSVLTAGYFSFAKTSDSSNPTGIVIIGSETVDRRRGQPEARPAGTKQVQEWTLRRRDNAPLVPLQLTLPDAALTKQTQNFADVHNQWTGWIFGNNASSCSCLNETAWFSMSQSIYAVNPRSQHALDRLLEFFAATGVDAAGHVMPFWYPAGYVESGQGPAMRQQVPHLILGVYEQSINTGNRAWLQRLMPTLDRVAAYLLAMDTDHDGIFEDPNSGLADGGKHVGSYMDAINSGHKDAMTNVYAVEALYAMAEMKAYLGDTAGATRFRDLHARSKAAYNTVFWDEEKGFYMDWIDVREQMPDSGRRYFYTDHNLSAITYGIADATKAQRILGALDARYDALCQQFHRQRDDLWATPGNMYPITRLGDMVDNGELLDQKNYPTYENGGSWPHTTGLEIAARGAAGQTEQAYATFERVMRQGYAHNRLWQCVLDWRTGMSSSEPLNTVLLIVWGFAYGCLGVRRTLQGVEAVGGSTPRLEGARHTFRHLGKNVTVQVRQGRPLLTTS